MPDLTQYFTLEEWRDATANQLGKDSPAVAWLDKEIEQHGPMQLVLKEISQVVMLLQSIHSQPVAEEASD